jgi:hypothetical protein
VAQGFPAKRRAAEQCELVHLLAENGAGLGFADEQRSHLNLPQSLGDCALEPKKYRGPKLTAQ